MAKLVVEVLNARDLLPTDHHGSPSPFVEVDFDGRRLRTQTKIRDLYPSWNEKLVFDLQNPRNLRNSIIEIILYDDHLANDPKNLLGCVQISGASVSLLESESGVQIYPLCKRGSFSHGRGDVALRIYTVRAQYYHGNQQPRRRLNIKKAHRLEETRDHEGGGGGPMSNKMVMPRPYPLIPLFDFPFTFNQSEEMWKSYSQQPHGLTSGGAENMNQLEERSPVDQLFVKVIRARNLPVTGDLGRYVEVKFRGQIGVTKNISKNESPIWDEVIAFNLGELEWSSMEVAVEVAVKDFGTDQLVGGRTLFSSDPIWFYYGRCWYTLVNLEGDIVVGEIMLTVWNGALADDGFPGAWHSDSQNLIALQNLTNTVSSVYISPNLYCLKVGVIEARRLASSDNNRQAQLCVKLILNNQGTRTKFSEVLDSNPVWNEDILLVASEEMADDFLIIDVVDKIIPAKEELIGRTVVPLSFIPLRFDSTEYVQPRWFSLNGVSYNKAKKQGEILLRLCLEAGYHVSNPRYGYHQPTAKHMKKDSIGTLELHILSAQGLSPRKVKDGYATTDAYCVAQYGNKWVRTRTVVNSQDPCWNEYYHWDVYDPCTVIRIGIFEDCKKGNKDMRIGKVCIQLQTLEVNCIHTNYYPLFLLHPSGVIIRGRLQVSVQFTGVSWPKMFAQYTKARLPKLHYLQPISPQYLDLLQYKARGLVAISFSKHEPPIKREIVEYMLDEYINMWSWRKHKVNFERVMSSVLGITAVYRWFHEICHWRNPIGTIFTHFLYLVFVWYPKLILPTFFLSLSVMGLWNYRFRPRNPPHLDVRLSQVETTDPDYLDEEFDTFPTSRPSEIVRMRYDRLRSIAGRYQTVVGDIATLGEKTMAILTCTDIRATLIFTLIVFFWVVCIYMASFRVVATVWGLYWLRHPWLRTKTPSLLVNLFKRLPSKMDIMMLI